MIRSKPTREIFRDCLKVVPNMMKDKAKVLAVRQLVRKEFERNKEEKSEEKITQLRDNAIRGISNYMIFLVKSEYIKNPTKKEFQSVLEDDDDANKQTIKPQEKS